MWKSETRNPKSEGSPKSEIRVAELCASGKCQPSDFGFRISFGLRISAFGF